MFSFIKVLSCLPTCSRSWSGFNPVSCRLHQPYPALTSLICSRGEARCLGGYLITFFQERGINIPVAIAFRREQVFRLTRTRGFTTRLVRSQLPYGGNGSYDNYFFSEQLGLLTKGRNCLTAGTGLTTACAQSQAPSSAVCRNCLTAGTGLTTRTSLAQSCQGRSQLPYGGNGSYDI